MNIEIISGSPRSESVTYRVALFLHKILTGKCRHKIGILDVRDFRLPLLQKIFVNIDSTPEPYKTLGQRMFSAHAFIIVTPEYNGSYSPAMKNLFDHFPKQLHKAFGIVTASPGATGGIRASQQVQLLINALFGIASPYMLIIPSIEKRFDAQGNLIDQAFQSNVDTFIHEFLWLAEKICPNG